MIKTLPISEARQNLTTLVDRASKLMDQYIITVNGRSTAILMSADEYASLIETNEILADKSLMKAIRQGEKEIERGEYITLEELKEELKLNV